jgi:hypothetical protein
MGRASGRSCKRRARFSPATTCCRCRGRLARFDTRRRGCWLGRPVGWVTLRPEQEGQLSTGLDTGSGVSSGAAETPRIKGAAATGPVVYRRLLGFVQVGSEWARSDAPEGCSLHWKQQLARIRACAEASCPAAQEPGTQPCNEPQARCRAARRASARPGKGILGCAAIPRRSLRPKRRCRGLGRPRPQRSARTVAGVRADVGRRCPPVRARRGRP